MKSNSLLMGLNHMKQDIGFSVILAALALAVGSAAVRADPHWAGDGTWDTSVVRWAASSGGTNSATSASINSLQGILAESRVQGGLVVHLGCGNGSTTVGLRPNERYIVHALDRHPDNVVMARRHIAQQGVYGKITVDQWSGKHLPYLDDMVNLLVVEDSSDLSEAEMMRVLTPGGVLCQRAPHDWTIKTKAWPHALDEWTHWLHGPDNNAVSRDTRVDISRNLQWIASPTWTRHHQLLPGFGAMVTAKGRIYYLIDQAPNAVPGPDRWILAARDAFNGIILWQQPMHSWGVEAWEGTLKIDGRMRFHGPPSQLFRRLVAIEDKLFVTPGFHAPLVALDGATGEVIRQYPGTERTAEVLYHDGRLILAENTYDKIPGKAVKVLDADTGEMLWRKTGFEGTAAPTQHIYRHTDAYLTLGGDHVFLVDRDQIIALDLHSGREAWRIDALLQDEKTGDAGFRFSNYYTLVYHKGVLFVSQIHPGKGKLQKWQLKTTAVAAYDIDTGKELWHRTAGTYAHFTPADLFVTGGKVWLMSDEKQPGYNARLLGLNTVTGAVECDYTLEDILDSHHHRCFRNKATVKHYLMGEEGLEYVNFDSGEVDVHHWLRGTCRYGILPANGLIYVPPHNCGCHLGTLLQGFLALTCQDTPVPQQNMNRLQTGPAYQSEPATEPAGSEDDWPVYRHDAERSSHVATDMPEELAVLWTTQLGGQLTPPIIADTKVFIGSGNCNQVYCLDAETGKTLWNFITDGPLDTPPSYRGGRLLFGTAGGSLYCLDPGTGELTWRFQVAPAHYRLMAHGRLESVWPLSGSVLVMDGSVYCIAGRSMHLNSGLFVCRIDLDTGELLQKVNLQADTSVKGETEDALLPDILVGDGKHFFMRNMRFNLDDVSKYEIVGGVTRQLKGANPKHWLQAGAAMNDDSGMNQAFLSYEGCKAQLLAFDGTDIFGVSGFSRLVPKASSQDVYTPGKGCTVTKWIKRDDRPTGTSKIQWQAESIPLKPRAMALTNQYLYLSGTPDTLAEGDVWGAIEGRQGARLRVISRVSGKLIEEYPLDSIPVHDGLVAADGQLFISLANGSITSMGK
ncbi:MAG: outer membrane protein assembly factor BamB family protein [Planctomycetota bacterium]